MSLIKGFHHINLKCATQAEYEAVISFYHTTLELPIARSWATGIMIDTGAGVFEITNNATDSLGKGVFQHLALATDDVDACADKVTAAGYSVFLGPKDISIPSDPPLNARIAFCHGPLGEEIEFFQVKDAE